MQIFVTLTNAFKPENIINRIYDVPDSYPYEKINTVHEALSNIFPDANVNFRWMPPTQQQHNFIYGVPVNQKLDEIRVEKNQLTWDAYMEIWYCYEDGKGMNNSLFTSTEYDSVIEACNVCELEVVQTIDMTYLEQENDL